ncbi:type 1 glutamine amidotransferase domain-containing protein [Rhizobium sp. RU36D]|uniref:DJ-1/PfpI/YhbO family deglycase/protease n=1 Tax=Rhizobium sp. RU36D TaxID=1907415 RepID=UPI0009D815E1|nr:type 1 glutamine amidotransferase domain-containing protein [Rhizobium sp. RU36D]SMD19614.1 protease I [Rhizobium sp. RU36D]
MPSIKSARVLFLATDGYERSELRVPLEKLQQHGATATIASLKAEPIKSWDEKNWGDTLDVDILVDEARVEDFDALVIPGGQINPDLLRNDPRAVKLVRDFVASGKVVAAICHGPWLLVEADALKGRKATSFGSIKTDLKNAGADWRDEAVVTDKGIVTSRSPADLEPFVAKIVEEIEEGRHERRAA